MKKFITISATIMFITLNISAEKSLQKIKNEKQKNVCAHKLPLPMYRSEKFDLAGKLKGLSKKQIEEHEELYQGYVNKRTEVAKALETVDLSKANGTYSELRALKLAETFAGNGDILHRLYFQNMGSQGKSMGSKTKELLIKNFGSVEKFKEIFFATAKAARGWVIVGYGIDDGRVHIYLLDAHNQKVPVLVIPLLVLDVYEHAYMIDFGIKRVPYLDVFWDNIEWKVVEHRTKFAEKYADIWDDYLSASSH